MIDFSNFEMVNEEAYVWRNFVGDELTDILFEESVKKSSSPDKEEREDTIELLHGDVDQRLIDKVNDFFKDTQYDIRYFLHWYNPANLWFPIHRDEQAYDITPFKKVWGGVIYLADMDGGELFYPINNTWVKPGKGDMVLHSASIAHGAVGVKGDNKRFITFVVYDKNQPGPNNQMNEKDNNEKTWNQIMDSKEWLESDIGKMWQEFGRQ